MLSALLSGSEAFGEAVGEICMETNSACGMLIPGGLLGASPFGEAVGWQRPWEEVEVEAVGSVPAVGRGAVVGSAVLGAEG